MQWRQNILQLQYTMCRTVKTDEILTALYTLLTGHTNNEDYKIVQTLKQMRLRLTVHCC